MVKIPKFSELTDLEKLKAFGNELANKAKDAVGDTEKMSEMARKVKSTVSDKTAEYTGNKKMPITDEATAKLVSLPARADETSCGVFPFIHNIIHVIHFMFCSG